MSNTSNMQPPEQLPTLDQLHQQLWQDIRIHRCKLLQQADIKINHCEDNGVNADNWRSYRQELRDLPQNYDNPTTVVWPQAPE